MNASMITQRYIGKRKYFIKYFGRLSKETKKVGVGANRLIRLLIKYIPKYILFYRNMKGVLLFRTLRQVHYFIKLGRGLSSKYEEEEEGKPGEIAVGGVLDSSDEIIIDDNEEDDDDDDDNSLYSVDELHQSADFDRQLRFNLSMSNVTNMNQVD